MWCGIGWVALLGILAWLFHSWPGGVGIGCERTPNGMNRIDDGPELGLIVAGLIALPLTLWRIRVADRQSKAAHQQVETSQEQVATSQRSLLNERYQKGAEMLRSEVLSVRLGGIYALARLAREHPDEYHMQIMRLFCAFVRNPTIETSEDAGSAESYLHRGPEKSRTDIQEIMTAIGKRSDKQIDIESKSSLSSSD